MNTKTLCGWAGETAAAAAWQEVKGEFLPPSSLPSYSAVRGVTARLWKFTRKVLGEDTKNYRQETGDCVSFGAKNAIEYLSCIEVADGDRERFRGIFPPYLYATGRVLVGNDQFHGTPGSLGSWMAAAVMKYGTIASGGEGVPDYSGRLADRWGDGRGFRDFVDRGDDHPIKSAAPVESWEQLCAAIGNGYPCTIASNAGYDMMAGRDGYHDASGHWPHQMCVVGVSDGDRPWAGILNSWGDVHGEIRDFETNERWPVGMLRIRKQDMERMIRSGECFAYSRFEGFPSLDLDWGRMS